MTNDEAKFILAGYRPGGADARAETFREALDQARGDPVLAGWLERSVAFDRAVSDRLKRVPVPPGLRESILAGGRLSRPGSGIRRHLLAGLAAAAVLAGFIGLSLRWRAAGAPFNAAQFAQYAIADIHAPGHKEDPDPTMQAWIATETAPLDRAAMPIDIARMRDSGCRILSFRGRDLIELCFTRGGVWFHLYLLPNTRAEGAFARHEWTLPQGAAAVWSDGRYTYALATTAAPALLNRLL